MNREILLAHERWNSYSRALRLADFNLADEELARAIDFANTNPAIQPIVNKLRENKAYKAFSPRNWLTKEFKGGSGLAFEEEAGISQRLSILEWASQSFQDTREPFLWTIGHKIYSGNDTDVATRVSKAVDFFFQPLSDFIDFQLRIAAGNIGEEPNSSLPYPLNVLTPEEKSRNVFVVHGRNTTIRDGIFSFLRTLDLHPIEWSEAVKLTGKTSPYIGEILDAAFINAQAIIVIFTPEDLAYLHPSYQKHTDPSYEKVASPQARPNVLFEAGMAMGRSQNRTVLIQFGEIRPFSDIAGRHMLHMDDSPEKRKDLATRLKSAGCTVNLDGENWLSPGLIPLAPVLAHDLTAESSSEPQSERLSPEEEDILSYVGIETQSRSSFGDDEINFASNLHKITKLKIFHILGRLEKQGFVRQDYDGYYLTESGLEYVVQFDLVEYLEEKNDSSKTE